eukprot:jgi/Astpho2/6828/Aster-06504
MAPAVIGSLPQGMTLDQRQRVMASTPLSPSLQLLNSMPMDKVGSRTMEGRRLRQHVLRGAVIVFITAGYSGKRFIFEKAKELGVRSVIIDGPDSWSQTLQDEGLIENFVGLDFADAETVYERCLTAISDVKQQLGELDGICTFCEMAVPLVSRLAEQFVDAARDKHAARAAMQVGKLPTPRHALIHEAKDLQAAGDHVQFPAVIKPIYGAASIGVVRVNNMAELQKTYKKVVKEMAGARIVAGALQQADASDEDEPADGSAKPVRQEGNASSWIKMTLMLEEYLDGPEVDVDLVLSEGQAVYGAITDNWPTVEPYFNETGSNCPSILPMKQQQELIELAVQAVQCLGFQMGVFHVELKYTSRGPRLIEINCRMGGGPVRNTNLLVWGVDMVEEHLLVTAGIPARPQVSKHPLMHIAEYSINAVKTGRMQNTDFLKEWETHPDVLYARPLVQAGQRCTAVTDGMPTWVAELMVTKPTVEEAIEFVKSIEQSLEIPIV